jgi:hypothetical protein
MKLKGKKIDEGRNKKERGLELTPYLKKKTERATFIFVSILVPSFLIFVNNEIELFFVKFEQKSNVRMIFFLSPQ